jgi:crotonyl-CoA reductase
MDSLAQAVLAGEGAEQIAAEPVPPTYRAAYLKAADADLLSGCADKDVRRTVHVGDVPMPELAPDEVLVAVMASSVNYNSVWSAMFSPMSTFNFLRRYGRQGGYAARHDRDYQVIGSDAAGVVVRVGAGVRNWQPGDHVVVHPAYVDAEEPMSQADGALAAGTLVWGFETNFGGMADYTVVRANMLLPKPAQLSWEEAASYPLCAGTVYRMLISDGGARIKAGDVVLIWGATGGVGSFAVQLTKAAGGIPVGIVGTPEKARLARELGCELVIDRGEIGMNEGEPGSLEHATTVGKRLGRIVRRELGEDPNVVFDHVGKATFGVSLFVVRLGGTVVTCGSSTGYEHRFDARYLWMYQKRVIGVPGCNLQEQAEMTRLIRLGKVVPVLSQAYPLAEAGEALRKVQENRHTGKVGVLCLAPGSGLGITDPAARERVGEDRLTLFRAATVSA